MVATLPRVLGLEDLLVLEKPVRERPGPLVYFSDAEFTRLTKGAVVLKRAPKLTTPLAAFDLWPGGGMVQSRCESPPGQICIGQWTPAGPDHGSGVFLGCRCTGPDTTPTPQPTPCQLMLDSTPRFRCVGECEGGKACRLARFQDPSSGRTTLSCACRVLLQREPI